MRRTQAQLRGNDNSNNMSQHFTPMSKTVPRKSIAARGNLSLSNEKNVVMSNQPPLQRGMTQNSFRQPPMQQQQQQQQQNEKTKFSNNPQITVNEAISLISYRLGILENKVSEQNPSTEQINQVELATVLDRLSFLEKEIPENLANKINELENHIFHLNELYQEISQSLVVQEEEGEVVEEVEEEGEEEEEEEEEVEA